MNSTGATGLPGFPFGTRKREGPGHSGRLLRRLGPPGPRTVFFLSSLLALSSLANPAAAATTYLYAGNDFVTVSGLFTTSDSVSLSFTLDNPIAPNVVDLNVSAMITAFSASNGVNMLTDQIPLADAGFVVTTDGTGAIVEWAAGAVFGALGSGDHSISCHVGTSITAPICPVGGEADSGFDLGQSPSTHSSGRVADSPGPWTIVPDPVPALSPTGIVILSSLLGLAFRFARPVRGGTA